MKRSCKKTKKKKNQKKFIIEKVVSSKYFPKPKSSGANVKV